MQAFCPKAFSHVRKRWVLATLLLAGACGGTREEFIAGRVKDRCEQAWPVCEQVAGCILGPESYLEGRFPGTGRFIVLVEEPATVKVSFFMEDVVSAGEETVMIFHEEGCRSRVRKEATGRVVMNQVEVLGAFSQEADLNGVGDHLIEFSSDLQGRYAARVDVSPKRNR